MATYDSKAECPLCRRPLGDDKIEWHHLTPKSKGGETTYPLHAICHRKIHATFNNDELAATYNTFGALRSHSAIDSFVKWVRKKDGTFYDRSAPAKRKKRK
jgi:5-methylcytosine-specific restriction endonuclease McrA